jgi:hypothetical protein
MVWAIGPRRFVGVSHDEAGANGPNHAARTVKALGKIVIQTSVCYKTNSCMRLFYEGCGSILRIHTRFVAVVGEAGQVAALAAKPQTLCSDVDPKKTRTRSPLPTLSY